MIRLVSRNLKDVTADALPPEQPEGRTRILILTSSILGFSTYGRMLEQYTAERDDVDAVHIWLDAPPWLKVLGKSVPTPRRLMVGGWRVPVPRGWDLHSYRYYVAWRRIIRSWLRGPLAVSRFDAVHITTQCNAGALVGLAPRVPTAFSVNLDITTEQEIRDFAWSRTMRRPFVAAERRVFAEADLITGMSEWACRSLREDYGVPADRVALVRGAIPLPEVSFDDVPHPTDRLPRMVFVGNAWVRKGGPMLLRLHQRHWADRCELHVFSSRAPRDASARNVVWHGFVDREKLMNELLPSMDLCVLPSDEDMSPWALVEAAGLGLPVVSSNVGGIGEIIVDGRTGILCPPNDEAAFVAATDRLLDDVELRRRMGRAGREHIRETIDPARHYNALLDHLQRISGAKRARMGVAGSTPVSAPTPAPVGTGA